MAQNVKKVASKNFKKPKVAENSKSCQNSKKLPKISKVAEKLPSNLWLSLAVLSFSFESGSQTNFVGVCSKICNCYHFHSQIDLDHQIFVGQNVLDFQDEYTFHKNINVSQTQHCFINFTPNDSNSQF